MRELYSQLYLDSNCTLPYNATTTVDDTIGTYVTNYLIWGAGLAIAFLLAVLHPASNRCSCWSRPILLYFTCTAMGYGIAGISHQVVHTDDDGLTETLSPIVLAFTAVGNAFLIATVFFPSPCNYNDRVGRNTFLAIVFLALHVTILVLAIYFGAVVIGLWMLATVVCMTLFYVFTCGKSCWNFAKALAMVIYAGGLLIQVTLRNKCGDKGYRDCFRDCPLPDPAHFNHNALFHVFVLISLILFGIAESQYPSSSPWSPPRSEEMDDKP